MFQDLLVRDEDEILFLFQQILVLLLRCEKKPTQMTSVSNSPIRDELCLNIWDLRSLSNEFDLCLEKSEIHLLTFSIN